jgi:hypothetical protein
MTKCIQGFVFDHFFFGGRGTLLIELLGDGVTSGHTIPGGGGFRIHWPGGGHTRASFELQYIQYTAKFERVLEYYRGLGN